MIDSRVSKIVAAGAPGTMILAVLYAAGNFFFPTTAPLLAQNRSSGADKDAVSAGPEVCAECHREIGVTYRRTGMARSFYRPSASNTVEDYTRNNTYYHVASDSYFQMVQRGGKYYQRRYQLAADGKPVNVVEKQIDFIMGSGNHSRAYLHRTAHDTLVELPLAWYAEKGGYWAMNPGYDRPDHEGFRREITYDCMFCHNAYPRIPPGNEQPFSEPVYTGSLPEGIDCQRCHGAGGRHVQMAKKAGATVKDIRDSILNPSRLSAQRQMEVCMQCHLETTSFPLPNSIQRYERGPFSYQPGESLAAFILFFDHAPGKGRDEKYEIVNAAYRLRRSACFLQSKGELRCTTCHNPHDIPRGAEAVRHYTAVCRQCHASAFDALVASGKHSRETGCTDCHMPKRRTEDVVHVAMTDHYIQRRKPEGDLLTDVAERHETEGISYRGAVVPYYPSHLDAAKNNDLYLALAQVIQKSNLTDGIARLTGAIARDRPERAEYYYELAEALRNNGQVGKALPLYEEAVRRNPGFVVGVRTLGVVLRRSGRPAEAVDLLTRAVALAPESASAWRELGLAYQAGGRNTDAIAALEKAVGLDPEMSEAYNNLGVIWSAAGEPVRAQGAFREAIRIQPDSGDAHGNLGSLLSATGDFPRAQGEFELALRLRPRDASTRYGYAMVLGRTRHFDQARSELEHALRDDPKLTDAHQLLADLLLASGEPREAIAHYREVLRTRPESGRAHLGLASALELVGDLDEALPHLRKAATDSDPAVRDEAAQALRRLGR